MKRLKLALLIMLLFTLAGCKAEQSPGSTWDRETEYSSTTLPEDCYLCGGGIEKLAPSYWGQENVALISLNTFEIVPLEINRYDKIDGHQIEEYAGVTSFGGGDCVGGGDLHHFPIQDRCRSCRAALYQQTSNSLKHSL